MPRWSRRLRIMLDWTVALVFSYDVVQLDFYHDRKISKLEEEKLVQTAGDQALLVETAPE